MTCRISADGKHHYEWPTRRKWTRPTIDLGRRYKWEAVTYCRECMQPAVVRVDMKRKRILIWDRPI